MTHPMQEFVLEGKSRGGARFRENAIVRYLLDNGGIDMNALALLRFSDEDRTQFAQLIGYSLKGYHELPYVSDEDALRATAEARKQFPDACGCRDHGCEIHCRGTP